MLFLYIVLGAAIVWQLAVWGMEIRLKNRQSRAARSYCLKNEKMLLVVGGSWGGRGLRRRLNMPAHILGDVNVDINSGAISGHPNGIMANVTNLPFPNKTFGSVLASHLLEHLQDTAQARQALSELERVADRVFIAYPYRQSIIAWLIPDHRLWVWQRGDTIFLKQRRKLGNKSISYTLGEIRF